MCVHPYGYSYICMCVHVCTRVAPVTHACVRVCTCVAPVIYACVCVCVHVWPQLYMRVCVCMYTSGYVCRCMTHVCAYTFCERFEDIMTLGLQSLEHVSSGTRTFSYITTVMITLRKFNFDLTLLSNL